MRSDREDLWFIVFVTLLIAGLGLLTILFEMGTLSNLNDLPHRTRPVASGIPDTTTSMGGSLVSGMPGGGGMIPPKGALQDGVGGPTPARAKFEDPTPDSVTPNNAVQERFPDAPPTPPAAHQNAPAVTAAKRRRHTSEGAGSRVTQVRKWQLPAPTDHNPQISECAYIPGVMRESTIVVSIATSLGCN
jgi:hypothetical protein